MLDRENKAQHTVGSFSLSVDLPHHFKGTHMSRFVEILNEHHGEITLRTMPQILRKLQTKLEAERAHVVVDFTYFITKAAPVSGARGMIDLNCSFIGECNGGPEDFLLKVEAPVTSLCPCSLEISDYGAHNQRGYLTMTIRTKRDRRGSWLTCALTMRLLVHGEMKLAGGLIGLGADSIKWLRAVRPGDCITAVSEIVAMRPSESKRDFGIVQVRTTTTNQRGEVVQVMVVNQLVRRRGNLRNG